MHNDYSETMCITLLNELKDYKELSILNLRKFIDSFNEFYGLLA